MAGLAARTLRIVRENLLFSIVYNVGVLVFSASGMISPIASAVAMLCSSLSVVANSARLARPLATAGSSTAPASSEGSWAQGRRPGLAP